MSEYFKDQGLYESRREHDACGIGAVANISGEKQHKIVQLGKQILLNLDHRGAASADNITGDGAGILFQIPDAFLREEASKLGFSLPETNKYGVAFVFNSKIERVQTGCIQILEDAIKYHGLEVLGRRDVPVDPSCLGAIALEAEPDCKQVIIGGAGLEGLALERKLYLARRRAERLVAEHFGDEGEDFYLTSMSSRTIVYKGMFMADQLFKYFPDLNDERVTSALALVHQRYSTNTLPNWRLAQPFRYVAHNGEINTLSGNINHMKIRETSIKSRVFHDDLQELLPVINATGSDSACFDNMLEFLELNGRSLPHSMMMMIPEAFGPKYHISSYKRSFYEYHSSIMEPWDGPAAMIFSDGRILGGTLDRNGLRPARYLVTTDGLVVMGSETGVVEFPPEQVAKKGRLKPGKMFLVDTDEKRIITDHEIKGKISRQKPYHRWLEDNRIELRGLFDASKKLPMDHETYTSRMRLFGYSEEDLGTVLLPMALNGQEPIGSMGNDEPLAALSEKPRLLFDYFKQLFAQVTNPPIDPLREALVMSLMSFTGRRRNLLEESAAHCKQLKLPHPILTNEDIAHLRQVNRDDFKVYTISSLFDATSDDPEKALQDGLDSMVTQAEEAIKKDASLLIVSDRGVSPSMAPIPSLLATSYLHNQLIAKRMRSEAGIIVESGEPREVMHFCLLTGCGANAVNPYMVFEAYTQLQQQGDIPAEMTASKIVDNYINAVKKGILKTMSKMGISTLRSYHTAQLFEAIGLNREFINGYFPGITSRIGGIGLDMVAKDVMIRHQKGYTEPRPGAMELEFGGRYHYRNDGEKHKWNPTTISKLQHAVFNDDANSYTEFAKACNDESKQRNTIRGLFRFKDAVSVPLDEVESAEDIVKRFCSGAMSHGSISQEAHECMAVAMNRLGAMSNTGEGGEDEARYTPEANGDSKNSAIKQVASGRFGVTMNYLAHAKEIQIKMAQGAKPGEGGQLPGYKVSEEIARLRYSTPGVTLISPPPHHDIYSIEDLAQLIFDLKCSNPGAKVSVKLVSEVGVGTIAAGVAKGNADEVLISSHDGGTGASPLSSIKHAGCPWELGIAEAQQVMVMNKLRDRTRLQVDGGLRTGRDVVIGAMLGAEQFGFGTAILVCMGCTLLRKCHIGTCSYGIATQVPELRARFKGTPEYITRYMIFIAEEVRSIMAQLGIRNFVDLIGRSDLLEMDDALEHYKAQGLDLSAILHQPKVPEGTGIRLTTEQPYKLADHPDWELIEQAKPAIEKKEKVSIDLRVRNVNRTVGTILSNKVVLAHGGEGLPEDTIMINAHGTAGQSFGAFLAPGITLNLEGDTNDYLGKGLCGGRIIVKTPAKAKYIAHQNIAVGNALFYGATRGEAFINGVAGERFCVRNSGVTAVVEGVGDHGCEYMTGGIAVVLGTTGCNFAAGMSGGIAYVFDEMELFDTNCNLEMVDLENVWREDDVALLRSLIEKHYKWTNSRRAEWILEKWDDMIGRFVKVMPVEYAKVLQRMRDAEERNADSTSLTEEVYRG
ncbi:MAG: glutamate synthase large subunit [Deltaproteobacteria bacterium]|nr:glutamate synthase large subunit [Deltaproteobacteria bacterium]MBN2670551.1 glutamate synthase large subunit [Deltaproteobacteria bacterium]